MYDLEIFLGLAAGVILVVLIMVFLYTILNHYISPNTNSTNRRKNQGIKNVGDLSRTQSCNKGVCPTENPNAKVLKIAKWS
jgi:hypothetical protein